MTFRHLPMVWICLILIGCKTTNSNPYHLNADHSNKWWDHLANYEASLTRGNSIDQFTIDQKDIDILSEQIFVSYLQYINDLGSQLSISAKAISSAPEIGARSGVRPFCDEQDLVFWNRTSIAALQSDYLTFEDSLCNRPCFNQEQLWTTSASLLNCQEKAKELYDQFQCDDTIPGVTVRNPDGSTNIPSEVPKIPSHQIRNTIEYYECNRPLPRLNPFECANLKSPPTKPVWSNIEFYDFSLIQKQNFSSNRAPYDPKISIPAFSGIRASPYFLPMHSSGVLESYVAAKVERCERIADYKLQITIAPPNNVPLWEEIPFDPAWVSYPITDSGIPPVNDILSEAMVICETADSSEIPKMSEVVMPIYERAKNELIRKHFGHLSIYLEDFPNDTPEENLDPSRIKEITSMADGFFHPIIREMDGPLAANPCADTNTDTPNLDNNSDNDNSNLSDTRLDEEEISLVLKFGSAIASGFTLLIGESEIGGNLPKNTTGLSEDNAAAIHSGNMTEDQRQRIYSVLTREEVRELEAYWANQEYSFVVEFSREAFNVVAGKAAGTAVILGVGSLSRQIIAIGKNAPGFIARTANFITTAAAERFQLLSDSSLAKLIFRPFAGFETGSIGTGRISFNQLDRLLLKGSSSHNFTRVDYKRLAGSQPHITLKNGVAINFDGTWKDLFKDPSTRLTNADIKFLKSVGWPIPK